jgi:hypothetical protein
MTDQELANKKHACLVYVTATEAGCDAARVRLEQSGYSVCEVKAELDVALAAQAGQAGLPIPLAECITGSDLCVFLLPEEDKDDCGLGGAAGLAGQLGKRMIGLVAGARTEYPESFEAGAGSMLRVGSDRLNDAIDGTEIWEGRDQSPVVDRPIKHIRCQ